VGEGEADAKAVAAGAAAGEGAEAAAVAAAEDGGSARSSHSCSGTLLDAAAAPLRAPPPPKPPQAAWPSPAAEQQQPPARAPARRTTLDSGAYPPAWLRLLSLGARGSSFSCAALGSPLAPQTPQTPQTPQASRTPGLPGPPPGPLRTGWPLEEDEAPRSDRVQRSISDLSVRVPRLLQAGQPAERLAEAVPQSEARRRAARSSATAASVIRRQSVGRGSQVRARAPPRSPASQLREAPRPAPAPHS
jgi:hypothetical protein